MSCDIPNQPSLVGTNLITGCSNSWGRQTPFGLYVSSSPALTTHPNSHQVILYSVPKITICSGSASHYTTHANAPGRYTLKTHRRGFQLMWNVTAPLTSDRAVPLDPTSWECAQQAVGYPAGELTQTKGSCHPLGLLWRIYGNTCSYKQLNCWNEARSSARVPPSETIPLRTGHKTSSSWSPLRRGTNWRGKRQWEKIRGKN